jgi:hypothetical protein
MGGGVATPVGGQSNAYGSGPSAAIGFEFDGGGMLVGTLTIEYLMLSNQADRIDSYYRRDDGGNYSSWSAGGNMKFLVLVDSPVRPFIQIGAGVRASTISEMTYHWETDNFVGGGEVQPSDSQIGLGFSAGVGCDVRFSDRAQLGIDSRVASLDRSLGAIITQATIRIVL